jgi:hypothetical protein
MFASVDWTNIFRMIWHGALLAGAAYIAGNPKQAWLAPVLQAFASASQSPLQAGRPVVLTNPLVDSVPADAKANADFKKEK